ncbi:MAG: hypothetical protein AAGD09_03335 [Cyanobacteria bacterium P01_F01_bin.56]
MSLMSKAMGGRFVYARPVEHYVAIILEYDGTYYPFVMTTEPNIDKLPTTESLDEAKQALLERVSQDLIELAQDFAYEEVEALLFGE